MAQRILRRCSLARMTSTPGRPPGRLETEEQGPRPWAAGDRPGDLRWRAPALALPSKTVFEHLYLVYGVLPFPDEPGTWLESGLGDHRQGAGLLQLVGELPQSAAQSGCQAAL